MRFIIFLFLLFPSFLFSQKKMLKNTQVEITKENAVKLSSPKEIADNNLFKLTFDNGQITMLDRGQVVKKMSSSVQKFEIYAGGGDDKLEVDLTHAQNMHIYYHGENNFIGTEGDILEIKGLNNANVRIDHFNKTDGKIYAGNNTVEFAGLEPVSISGPVANFNIILPDVNQTVILGDDMTTNDGFSLFESTSAETTTFQNPTVSFTLSGGSGDDVVNFNGLDMMGIPPNISLDGGAGTNSLIVDAKGNVPSDDGSTITIPGFYTINYTNFASVSFINVLTAQLVISPILQAAEDATNGRFTVTASSAIPSTIVTFSVAGTATEAKLV